MGVHDLRGVLYNRQAEACPADLTGMTLVHTEEALENPGLILFGNADSVILHTEYHRILPILNRDIHPALAAVVFDGIVNQVEDDTLDQPENSIHCCGCAVYGQCDLVLQSFLLQLIRDLECNLIEVYLLPVHINGALIQVRDIQDILNERDHALCLGIDGVNKPCAVFLLHLACFQKLCTTRNRMKRRFQLMRHVGGELSAQLFRLFPVRHIEQQHHHARSRTVGRDRADIRLVAPAGIVQDQLAVLALCRALQRLLELRAPVQIQDILSDTALVRVQQLHRLLVDRQDLPGGTEQDQALLHPVRHRQEILLCLLEVFLLVLDLLLLFIDMVQEGSHLRIGLVVQRMIKVKIVERIHNLARKAGTRQPRQTHENQEDPDERLHHTQCHSQDRIPRFRNPYNRPIRKLHRIVEHRRRHGVGVAGARSFAIFQRLGYFRSRRMVFHLSRVCFIVKQDRSVRGNPCYARALHMKGIEKVRAPGLDRLRGKFRLYLQLLFLYGTEITIQGQEDCDESSDQRHKYGQFHVSEYFLCHGFTSL